MLFARPARKKGKTETANALLNSPVIILILNHKVLYSRSAMTSDHSHFHSYLLALYILGALFTIFNSIQRHLF
jgi:hypothetical protein